MSEPAKLTPQMGADVLLGLVLFIPALLWQSFVLRKFFVWFVPALQGHSLFEVAGALFIFRELTMPLGPGPTPGTRVARSAYDSALRTLMALGCGWLLHLAAVRWG